MEPMQEYTKLHQQPTGLAAALIAKSVDLHPDYEQDYQHLFPRNGCQRSDKD